MITCKKEKKGAPTVARLFTPQDYEERQGLVSAPEGILPFTAGDYLAKDAKGEWTIWQATMRDKYVQVSPEDEEGFAHYVRTDVSFAAQMPEPFTLDMMRGKSGDYLVINDGSAWPVARDIFEQSYELVEEQQEEQGRRHDHPSSP